MTQLLAIIGMGSGNGMAIAKRFAQEGFAIAMLARNPTKLQTYKTTLQQDGFTAHYFVADAEYPSSIAVALANLERELGLPDILFYHAAVSRLENVLETLIDALLADFQTNVSGALVSVQSVLPGMLKSGKIGTILFNGGEFPLNLQPNFASLSIGKAGLRI